MLNTFRSLLRALAALLFDWRPRAVVFGPEDWERENAAQFFAAWKCWTPPETIRYEK